MSRCDKTILCYHDCVLRQSDVDLLLGPNWINDVLIGFYYEYLQKKLESSDAPEILYACPELTQLLKLTDSSEISIFLDPLNASEKKFIFFPLNNCERRDSAGGSHWSLLVFSKVENTFFHFDSFGRSNENIARDFARNLDRYLLRKELGEFVETDCPQQENCVDCGLFVMCITDVLTEHVVKYSQIKGFNLQTVKRLVLGKRESLLELINVLKEAS